MVRDLYDIYFLLNQVERKGKLIAALKKFLTNFKPPKDAATLKALITTGSVSTVKDMMDGIRRWVR